MTWASLRIDMFFHHNLKTQKQLQGHLLTPAPPPEWPCCYLYFPLPSSSALPRSTLASIGHLKVNAWKRSDIHLQSLLR